MTKKYFDAKGNEVHIGDSIKCNENMVNTEAGKYYTYEVITVTRSNIKNLIKGGVIKVKKYAKPMIVKKIDLRFAIQSFADSQGWTFDKAKGYLDKLLDINPAAAYAVLLKVIAKHLDKNYDDHISKAKTLYAFGNLRGCIIPVDPKAVVSFNTFAAFRTMGDAKTALNALKPVWDFIIKKDE